MLEGGGRMMKMTLAGRQQAEATAAGAAELVRALAACEIDRAGVWFPEQVVSHERFFEALSSLGYNPTLEDITEPRESLRRTVSVRQAQP
jgi:hypothetical protein